jgi:catechol 2,3-dioxygenase-like lactoylglutathione lyase family enzyme
MTELHGVDHSARPTWKLRETIEFYRDIMGLKLRHVISAKGWGPEGHPDFLHFFFDSGRGSTIAFFYYLGTERPERIAPFRSWFYTASHTAWRVESRDELFAWKELFERAGVPARIVVHELIESLYVTDPNGYAVEMTLSLRDVTPTDVLDGEFTLEAAVQLESETGGPAGIASIEEVWRRKARLVERYLKNQP